MTAKGKTGKKLHRGMNEVELGGDLMSNLEHCLENAIVAIEDGKDYDQWRYEEIPRHNATPFNRDWAILTDESIINLKDIWAMATYVAYMSQDKQR